MKKCTVCGQEKPVEDYAFRNKAKGTRQPLCRSCHSTRMKKHYRDNVDTYKQKAKRNTALRLEQNRSFVFDHLSTHPCVDCGEPDPIVLEFDHQRDKSQSVSVLVQDCGLNRVIEEIGKCEVVCANCHRRRTATTFGYWKIDYKPL